MLDQERLVVAAGSVSDFPLGYGYQWWLMDGDAGECSAIGVHKQFIYVHPQKRIGIVKLSANSEYGTTPDGSLDRKLETIELFRAIAGASGDRKH